MSDSILHHASKGISDLINVHGLVNLDFADVVTVMKNMGEAVMGTGIASGEERAELAAQQAISSPLLENASISGAQGVLVNITGGPGLTLIEVDQATKIIFEQAGEDANIIFGAVIDVFKKEPPDDNNPLLKNEKVYLSPHTAAFTDECMTRMGKETIQNIIDFFEEKLEKSKIVKL